MKTLVINAHPGFTNHEHFSVQLQDKFIEWSYTIKVDRKLCVIICLLRHKNERFL